MRGAVPGRCNSQTLRSSASTLPNNELYDALSNVTVSSSWTRYYKKDLEIIRQAPPPHPHVYLTFSKLGTRLFTVQYQSTNFKSLWNRNVTVHLPY